MTIKWTKADVIKRFQEALQPPKPTLADKIRQGLLRINRGGNLNVK